MESLLFSDKRLCTLWDMSQIRDGNFDGSLWSFKPWLALKMRVHCETFTVLLLTSSFKVFLRYVAWWLIKLSYWFKVLFWQKIPGTFTMRG